MYSLLITFLLLTAPVAAETPAYCEDVYAVLMDAVEEGVITYKEAIEMHARCARAPDL